MNQLRTSPCRHIPIAFAAAIILLMAAPAATAQVPRLCTEEGAWRGAADNGFTWMNIVTRGADATAGQLDLAWVVIDPTLGGVFAVATRVTPARGVWKKDGNRDARWTWITFGLDTQGTPIYAIRASGTHHMPDCQHLEIAYALEVFLAAQDMASDTPIAVIRGTALETRIPLVQLPGGY